MSSLDVIVPCYGYGRYLIECVRSVLTQSGVDVRVLIIDDHSPDDTPQVGQQLAAEDTRVSYRRHAQNMGHIATYNEGIDWAVADYLLLLSADDYLLPGALSRAAALMDASPGMGLCFGNALELLPDGSMEQASTGTLMCGASASQTMAGVAFIELSRSSGVTNIVPTPTAVVRTAMQKGLGGYRPELPHTADLELWLRLAAHGPVGFVSVDQAVYRRHAANMSLAYLGDMCIADLRQRRAAIELFCNACTNVLPERVALRQRLLERLSLEAIGRASSAFNDGRPEASRQLGAFALELNPGATRSLPWVRLALKRRIGNRASRALLPTVGALRKTVARVFG